MDVYTPQTQHYRVYGDGTESGSTALAANDTFPTVAAQYGSVSSIVHLRLCVVAINTAGAAAAEAIRLQVSRNGGAFQDVTAASTICRAVASGLTDDGATTDRAVDPLTDGAGAFQAGVQEEADGTFSHQLNASSFTEHVFALEIVGNDVANGDDLTFQLTRDGTVIPNTGVTPTIDISQTNPTISSATMTDANRNWDTPHQDIEITFSEAVQGFPGVGVEVPGLTASVNGGSNAALTYVGPGGSATTHIVRRAELIQANDTVTLDYVMATGAVIATDDSAELRETDNAAVTNSLTVRVRFILKRGDTGAVITTPCSIAQLDAEPRDQNDASWLAVLQRHVDITPSGSGQVDLAADASLVVGDPVYVAVFNPREDATGTGEAYNKTTIAVVTAV